jgi:hypothetical protein
MINAHALCLMSKKQEVNPGKEQRIIGGALPLLTAI